MVAEARTGRIRQSSAVSSGVAPSGNCQKLDESGKFWTNGHTSGCFARFCPNSLPVCRPRLSILPPLPGDEVRQAVCRPPTAGVGGADGASGATGADGRESCRPPLSRPFGAGEPPATPPHNRTGERVSLFGTKVGRELITDRGHDEPVHRVEDKKRRHPERRNERGPHRPVLPSGVRARRRHLGRIAARKKLAGAHGDRRLRKDARGGVDNLPGRRRLSPPR